MVSSDCPTQDCVHTGTITRSGQSIVCLPARVSVVLTGGADSRAARQRLLEQLDLPERLSTNALLEVLNALMTREAFRNLCK